jgi:hypothetical protein
MATYYAGRLMRRQTVLRLAGKGFEDAAAVLRKHGIAGSVDDQLVDRRRGRRRLRRVRLVGAALVYAPHRQSL